MEIAKILKPYLGKVGFGKFLDLTAGMALALGPKTVCELYAASGMEGHWTRAHKFFSEGKWSPDMLGLAMLDLIVERLVPKGARIDLVGDGTLWRRYGREIFKAFYQYDPSPQVPGNKKIGFGNGWVVLGIIVHLPFCDHEICLPLLARMKGKSTSKRKAKSDSELVLEMVKLVEARLPKRRFLLRVDAAFKILGIYSECTDVVTRATGAAALYEPPPVIEGKRGKGRPRVYGDKLGKLTELASDERYPWEEAKDESGEIVRKLKYIPCRRRATKSISLVCVLVIEADELAKPEGKRRPFSVALLCTDTSMSAQEVQSAYAGRWSIENCFQDVRHVTGVGQQRSWCKKSVQRAVPFGLLAHSLILTWFSLKVDHEHELQLHNQARPWHRKQNLSTSDALARLRFEIVVGHFSAGRGQAPPAEKSSRAEFLTLRGDTLMALATLVAA